MTAKNKFAVAAAMLAAMVLMYVPKAKGDTITDPHIYVCTGCTDKDIQSGNPNIINPGSINIGFVGSHTAVSPLLVIVGVPNGGSAPTISLPSGVKPDTSEMYYGLNNATSGTTTGVFEGTLPVSLTGTLDACTQSGLDPGDCNSENSTNWTTYDESKGISLTSSFNLYAYAINFSLISDTTSSAFDSPITIDFSGLTLGSYVLGYACLTAETVPNQCSPSDGIGSTPFTTAGADVTPEASTLPLLGFGLIGLAGLSLLSRHGSSFRVLA